MSVLQIPVIDLFAGPGGLGEGFSALQHDRVEFDVMLSVEKEPSAYQTLLLRSFFRSLDERSRRGYITITCKDECRAKSSFVPTRRLPRTRQSGVCTWK
jgi:site-specific DNA-cytosine methylase